MTAMTTPRYRALPRLESIKIRLLGLIWGVWLIVRLLLRRLWYKEIEAKSVGSPPECMISPNLGKHNYVKIKGIKLHYVEAGNVRDPLLLLLHGFPDLWLTWRHQIPELSKYYRVVALDMKGFGDSDKPISTSAYDMRIVTDELSELVSSLGYKKCTVVGHDLGGLVGWYLVHGRPDLVDKFVAISAPHPNLYWDAIISRPPFDSRWVQFCTLPFLPETKALENNLSVIDNLYSHLDNTIENKTFVNAYKYAFSRKEDWSGPINYYRNLAFWRLVSQDEEIEARTLLIVGNREPRDFFEAVVKSSSFVFKYSLKVVENASRFVHHERPAETNRLILNFLRGQQHSSPEKKEPPNGLVTRLVGAAVSTTLSYGNGVFDVVKSVNKSGLRAITLGNPL